MQHLLGRTWAEIDLDALTHNYKQICSHLNPGCQVMAVVKANAYGHGIEGVAKALGEAGVSWFGVSNIDEALQLRRLGCDQRILILSYSPPDIIEILKENRVTTAIACLEHAKALSEEAVRLDTEITVHIKVDTGMSRVGCRSADEILEISKLKNLNCEGIFTHFAVSDEIDGESFSCGQFTIFENIIAKLKKQGVSFPICHACNSAAALRFKNMHLDMVRTGLILYGTYPDQWLSGRWGLTHALALKTAVIQVKTIKKGVTVSYGRTFTAENDMTVATVPIGYADGYPRSASNKGEMLVNGIRAKIIGRVCMDLCVIDVTGIPDVSAGTVVTVFGGDGNDGGVTVQELSGWDNTISYETLCRIGKRVPRVFYRDGIITDIATGI